MKGIKYETVDGMKVATFYAQAARTWRGRRRIGIIRARRILPCPAFPAGKILSNEWCDGISFPDTDKGWDDCAAYVLGINKGENPAPDGPTTRVSAGPASFREAAKRYREARVARMQAEV